MKIEIGSQVEVKSDSGWMSGYVVLRINEFYAEVEAKHGIFQIRLLEIRIAR